MDNLLYAGAIHFSDVISPTLPVSRAGLPIGCFLQGAFDAMSEAARNTSD
jgi:hypothetical protein